MMHLRVLLQPGGDVKIDGGLTYLKVLVYCPNHQCVVSKKPSDFTSTLALKLRNRLGVSG
jgi:hypothetical protein